jgi:tetratricopeptide (TPR) repeat protein
VITALLAKDPAQRPLPLVPAIEAMVGEATLPAAPRPPRSKRWWLAVPLVLAAIGAGAVWMLSRDRGGDAAEPSCPSGVERLAGVWDPMVKASVMSRFLASPKSFVRDFGKVAFDVTDNVVADLRAGQDAYCREAGTVDPLLHAQRDDCLDERVRQLQLEIKRWQTDDVEKEALIVPERIVNMTECQDDRIVRAQLPPLRDEAARAAEAAALTEIDTAVNASGFTADATALAAIEAKVDAAIKQLEDLKAPGTLGAKLRRARFVRFQRREFERGAQLIDAVTNEAERGRDDNVLAEALQTQIIAHFEDSINEGRMAYRPDLIARLLDREAVAVERAGNRPHQVHQLMRDRAVHAFQIGKPDDATRISDEIIQFAEKTFGPESAEVASARVLRSEYAQRLNDGKRMVDELQRASAVRAKLIGPRHPGTMLSAYVLALQLTGRHDESIEYAKAHLRVVEEAMGPTSWQALISFDVLGHSQGTAGRLDDAIATYKALLARFEPVIPNDARLGWQHFKLGQFLVQRGNHLESVDHLLRSEAIHEKTLGADHIENVRGPRLMLPHILYGLGRVDETRRRVAALSALFAQDKFDPKLRAELSDELEPLVVLLGAVAGDVAGGERTARAKLAACPQPVPCTMRWRYALADILVLARKHRAAVEEYARLIEQFRGLKVTMPGHQAIDGELYGLQATLAKAKLLAGDPSGARQLLEDAALAMADYQGDVRVAEGGFTLARALLATGGDRARAIELARSTAVSLAAFGEGEAAKVREIERWLAAQSK